MSYRTLDTASIDVVACFVARLMHADWWLWDGIMRLYIVWVQVVLCFTLSVFLDVET